MSDVEKCGCEESQDLALALGVALSTLRDRGVEVSGLAGMTVTLIKERDEARAEVVEVRGDAIGWKGRFLAEEQEKYRLRAALESVRTDLRESVIREFFIVKGVLATIDAVLAPPAEPKSPSRRQEMASRPMTARESLAALGFPCDRDEGLDDL